MANFSTTPVKENEKQFLPTHDNINVAFNILYPQAVVLCFRCFRCCCCSTLFWPELFPVCLWEKNRIEFKMALGKSRESQCQSHTMTYFEQHRTWTNSIQLIDDETIHRHFSTNIPMYHTIYCMLIIEEAPGHSEALEQQSEKIKRSHLPTLSEMKRKKYKIKNTFKLESVRETTWKMWLHHSSSIFICFFFLFFVVVVVAVAV